MGNRSHPLCWDGEQYLHIECVRPSGHSCVECGEPAGTLWGRYWCPDCDVNRLDKVAATLEEIKLSLGEKEG